MAYSYKIGIDLGGTKIEGVLLDEQNNILMRKRVATQQEHGYEFIINRIVNLTDDLKKSADDSVTIGIGTPGTISPKTSLMRNSNTLCLNGQPLKQDLEQRLGQSIKIANDANCFAVAEATMGAAKGVHMVFGVIMGTGVGGGIVINGKVHDGKNFVAGEWGHSTLRPDGRPCYCGKRGCVETYISGTALEKLWMESGGKKLALKDIVQKAEQELDAMTDNWKQEFIENFGIALANIINILDPDAIVLGGGVSNVSFLYNEGIKAVHKNVFSDIVETLIVQNELGDSAGVIGAALL